MPTIQPEDTGSEPAFAAHQSQTGALPGWAPSSERHPAASPFPADTGSFVARKVSDATTLRRLVRATERAIAAVTPVLQEVGDDTAVMRQRQTQYVDLVFRQEIAFLFPQLPSQDHDVLTDLMKVRNAIGVHLNGLPQWRTPEQGAEHQQLTHSLQAEFDRLVRAVEANGIEARLDHVQRRLLRDEFLSIVLDKSNSTQIYFRRGGSRSPAADRESAVPVTQAASSTAARRILLLSNQPREAEGIACWLETAGYEVRTGAAAFEGCRLAVQQVPDLVILDFAVCPPAGLSHSAIDSRTILQLLQQVLRGHHLPAIGLVDAADFEAPQQLARAGGTTCLRRPLDPHRLLTVVQTVLPRSEHVDSWLPADADSQVA